MADKAGFSKGYRCVLESKMREEADYKGSPGVLLNLCSLFLRCGRNELCLFLK